MSSPIDQERFSEILGNIYQSINDLENMFPGRPFTPDGHLVGSIGECIVAAHYNLILMPPSNKGFDGIDQFNREIEIKATQSNVVAFRSEPQYCIVIKLSKEGTHEEIYNGPGHLVWNEFKGRTLPSNGQHQIRLSKLRKLQGLVPSKNKIPSVEH